MNLVHPKLVDTTNRSLVRAFTRQYRPGATEADLHRPLYYLTPYVTCSKCNSILFVDAANARTFGAAVPADVREKRGGDETLGVCPGCAMTEHLEVGAHDYLEDIEGAREAMAKQMKLRQAAAQLLIEVYRFYLRRQLARAGRTRDKARRYLFHRCAAIIEALGRGRLGRRRAITFEHLKYPYPRRNLPLRPPRNIRVGGRGGAASRLHGRPRRNNTMRPLPPPRNIRVCGRGGAAIRLRRITRNTAQVH